MASPDPLDPVAQRLGALGIPTSPHRIGQHSLPIGTAFEYRGCAIAYRFEPPDSVVIILVHGLRPRRGLGSPFRVVAWFLDLLAAIPEVARVVATAGTNRHTTDETPSVERLTLFYRRHFGGVPWKQEWGRQWLQLDLMEHRQRRLNRQRGSTLTTAEAAGESYN